jgi:ABC-2 type transport system permease protein
VRNRPAFWHIAENDLRLLLRERGTLFWSFLGPVIFAAFFGLLFRDSPHARPRPAVRIENHDSGSFVAGAMGALLADEGLRVVKETGAAYKGTAVPFVLVVAAGAAESLAAGRMPEWILRSPGEGVTMEEQSVAAKVHRTILRLLLGLDPEDYRGALDAARVRDKVRIEPTIRLVARTPDVNRPVSGFQRSLPSYFVMMTFLNLFTYSAAMLIEERRRRHLLRVLVAPVAGMSIVAGKLLSRVVWIGLQVALMLAVGLFVFRIRMGAHLDALLLLLGSFAVCSAALGLLYATFFESADKAAALGSLIAVAISALGGCWWPVEITPVWMRSLALLLPTGWAMNGIFRVMAFDATISGIAAHLAVFFGSALLCAAVAARRLLRRAAALPGGETA